MLFASGIPIFWMEWALVRGGIHEVKVGLHVAFLMGAPFLANTGYDFRTWSTDHDTAYGSLFTVIIGLHAIHVIVGLLMSLTVQAKVWTGRVAPKHHVNPEVFALYWHFVDGVWIFVFTSLFVSVHLV